MIDEIVSNGIVSARLDRDLDLRADAVGAGDEHRLPSARRHAKHPAESPEPSARAGGERRLDQSLDARLRIVGGIDVDAGRPVVEGAAALRHAFISCSKATSW